MGMVYFFIGAFVFLLLATTALFLLLAKDAIDEDLFNDH